MKRTRISTLAVLCCVAALACGCFLSACAQDKPAESPTSMSASPATSSSAAAPEQATHPAIGAGDTTVQVTNQTGSDIVGLRIKPVTQESYGAENSFDGFEFENGETVELSFDRVAGASSYDIVLLTSEDGKIAIRDVSLVDREDLTFRFEEGVGFISYTDAATGQTVDNRIAALDAEQNATVVPDDLKTQQG